MVGGVRYDKPVVAWCPVDWVHYATPRLSHWELSYAPKWKGDFGTVSPWLLGVRWTGSTMLHLAYPTGSCLGRLQPLPIITAHMFGIKSPCGIGSASFLPRRAGISRIVRQDRCSLDSALLQFQDLRRPGICRCKVEATMPDLGSSRGREHYPGQHARHQERRRRHAAATPVPSTTSSDNHFVTRLDAPVVRHADYGPAQLAASHRV